MNRYIEKTYPTLMEHLIEQLVVHLAEYAAAK